MCGIFGYFGDDTALPVEQINLIKSAMSHRGPDDFDFCKLKNGYFFHSRLSIVGLQVSSRQPMLNKARNLMIIFNGEISNYLDLKNELIKHQVVFDNASDTEVILKGYEIWGVEVFNKLNGMFSIAIHDGENNRIILARDRLGIKPLYYTYFNNTIYFSSEIKFLKLFEQISLKIEVNSLPCILKYGSAQEPNTIYKNVFIFNPGAYAIIDGCSELRPVNFVCKSAVVNSTSKYEQSVSELRKILLESVQRNLMGDVDVGCFLSGGIDSSAILGMMKYLQPQKAVKAFTLTLGANNKGIDESSVARETCKTLGVNLTEIYYDEDLIEKLFFEYIQVLDQPSIDGFNTFLVSKGASNHVKVVLSGLGGDELFGGYKHFDLIYKNTQVGGVLDKFLSFLYSSYRNKFTFLSHIKGKSVFEVIDLVRTIYTPTEISNILKFPDVQNKLIYESKSIGSPLRVATELELQGYLRNTLLRDSDIVSMSQGLEVRPILLDNEILNFVNLLPDEYKVENRLKRIFVDAAKEFIPPVILNREKTGFNLPYVQWMNGPLNGYINKLLSKNLKNNLFNIGHMKKIYARSKKRNLEWRDWLFIVIIGWVDINRVDL